MYPNLNSELFQHTNRKFELTNGLKMYWGEEVTEAASAQMGSYYYSRTSMKPKYPSGFTPQILIALPKSGNEGINVDLRAESLNTIFYKTTAKDHVIAFFWFVIGY